MVPNNCYRLSVNTNSLVTLCRRFSINELCFRHINVPSLFYPIPRLCSLHAFLVHFVEREGIIGARVTVDVLVPYTPVMSMRLTRCVHHGVCPRYPIMCFNQILSFDPLLRLILPSGPQLDITVNYTRLPSPPPCTHCSSHCPHNVLARPLLPALALFSSAVVLAG